MPTVFIAGKGPAGISAALYTSRAGIDTLIIGKDGGALEKTEKIENYYGFAQPVSGKELLAAGIENARRLGCTLIDGQVVGISWDGRYTVSTDSGDFQADAVILATGAVRNTPRIPGIDRLEGHGISYCAVCDAFFYRGKDVAVLGNGEYALHEALELLPVVHSVTLLTNGLPLEAAFPPEIAVDPRPIASLEGEQRLERVAFQQGGPLSLDGLFVAAGVASSSDLARKLGAETDGSRIVVNGKMETALPGLFAAGDCTGGLLQIAKAVSDGAIAGTQAIQFIRRQQAG